jgi:hypothetical protein
LTISFLGTSIESLTVLTLARNANTDGWGNKLVTIFALYLDNFIMTVNFSLICQIFSGSGQILQPRQILLSPGSMTLPSVGHGRCKNYAIVACPPGLIRPKVPGHVSAGGATNVYSLNRRAVGSNPKRRHDNNILPYQMNMNS